VVRVLGFDIRTGTVLQLGRPTYTMIRVLDGRFFTKISLIYINDIYHDKYHDIFVGKCHDINDIYDI